MTPQDKLLARVFFKLKIIQADGAAYETLFGHVMDYSRPAFTKIRPYGNQGDRGNDGYENEHGRYFQVFAPEKPKASIKAAIEKAHTDFRDKLIPHWGSFCEVKEYYFVFNDKYQGCTFDIEKKLAEIKQSHKLTEACVYLAKHLEDECLNLKEDQILLIVGGIPKLESSTKLEYSILKEVIDHIQNTPPELLNKSNLTVPDIDEKIKFNQLNLFERHLKAKQLETWQVDDYFSNNSDYAKQELREHLAGYYAESLIKFPDAMMDKSDTSIGDLRFAFILDKISPATKNTPHDRLRRDAALIIMAKYFETCDIFEEPK
jgi:hypothetical protein